MHKDMNSKTTTTRKVKKTKNKKDTPNHQNNYNPSNRVDSFVAISNSLPNFGKGLAWTLGAIIGFLFISTIIVFVWSGLIPPEEVWEFFVKYLMK